MPDTMTRLERRKFLGMLLALPAAAAVPWVANLKKGNDYVSDEWLAQEIWRFWYKLPREGLGT